MVDPSTHPSDEQAAIVGWIAGLGAVTAAALAEHLGIGIVSCRARLGHLRSLGLLVRHDLLKGHPGVYTVSPPGLRRCAVSGLDPCRVSPSSVRHLAICSEVAARLERCYPDRRLAGERELRRAERLRGVPLASCRLDRRADGLQGLHRPDLVLWPSTFSSGLPADACVGGRGQPIEDLPHRLPGELPVAVEVELTVKAPARLAAICLAWARCRSVAGVLYLVSSEAGQAVTRAVEQTHAGRCVAVIRLDLLGAADLPRPDGGRMSRAIAGGG